jgi:CheY-like chemotaxis protein
LSKLEASAIVTDMPPGARIAPRRQRPSERDDGSSSRGAGGARDKTRVLVVDDLEDNRELYASYLEIAGFDVEKAIDGRDALDRVAAIRPDLVVMDLAMPRLDGWEATRLLKADPATRDIPVLVLTAYANEEDLQRARAAGADDVATKPMVPRTLLARVKALLGEPAAAEPAR